MADYTLSAKILLDSSNLEQGAKKAKGAVDGMTSGMGGMTKAVTLGNVAAGIFNKSMGVISGSIGNAVNRIDTMQNFPVVMESLGHNAEDASRSIQKISESLDGLPTSTDAVVSMVQQLAPLTSNLDEATTISLAMNNALLAGGKSMDEQSRAMVQYVQMLSTGKVDMQSWKSLQQAMPGQLDQIAKSMLGAEARGMDLYAAMRDGTISFDDFNNAVLKLNQEGLPGMKSFEEQARAATGGIQTSMDNLKNRISKGLADILDGIGRERISGFINDFSITIKDQLSGLSDVAGSLADTLFPILQKVVEYFPQIAKAVVGITGVKFAWKGLNTGIAALTNFGTTIGDVAGKFSMFAGNVSASLGTTGKFSSGIASIAGGLSKLSPLALGAAGALAGVVAAVLVKTFADAIQNMQNISAATDGIRAAALGATGELKNLNAELDVSDRLSTSNAKSLEELSENGAKVAQGMVDRNTAVADSNALLDVYMNTIEELNGKYSSTEEDGARLKLAVEELNKALGTEYTVELDKDGRYRVMAGDAAAATEEIGKLVQMKQAEARVEAYSENYKDAFKQQAEAARTMADIRQQIAAAEAEMAKPENAEYMASYQAQIDALNGQLATAQEEYDAAGEAAGNAQRMMENAATAAEEGADSYFRLAESNTQVSAIMADNNLSISDFTAAMQEAGITEQQFGQLSEEQAGRFAAAYASAKKSGDNVKDALKGVAREINNVDKKDPNVNVTESGADATAGKLDNTAESANGIPKSKSVTITADTSKATNTIASLRSTLRTLVASKFAVSVGASIAMAGLPRASGGIFLGNPNIIPRHADGGILTQPTLTSVGWVGEAGAEAIIPLTNKTYIKPFAQTVAAEMGGGRGGDVYVTLAYNAGADAKQMARDLSREIKMRRALEVY